MTYMEELLAAIRAGAPMTTAQIAEKECDAWLRSPRREEMLAGQRYYGGHNDILDRHRTAIGKGGVPERVRNMADNHLSHGFLTELVDQKIQYLLGKPYTLRSADGRSAREAAEALGEGFPRMLMRLARDAVNKGIGWLYVERDAEGCIRPRRMEPEEMIPLWADRDHTRLAGMIRCRKEETWEGPVRRIREKAEFWTEKGVEYFQRENGRMVPDPERSASSMLTDRQGRGWNWERLPFIPLRYNDGEQPLLSRIRTLVDEYDRAATGDANMLQDQPDSILVLRNYDGTDLGEFRQNLAAYRAVKVTDQGGVEALHMPPDVEASNRHMERLRRDIYAFGRGVDTRSERFAAGISGVALRHEYAQLDMDVSELERGVQEMLDQLVWFIGAARGRSLGRVQIICNRDILTSEEAAVTMCRDSGEILSRRTVLENHPWVEDAEEEIRRLQAEAPQEKR